MPFLGLNSELAMEFIAMAFIAIGFIARSCRKAGCPLCAQEPNGEHGDALSLSLQSMAGLEELLHTTRRQCGDACKVSAFGCTFALGGVLSST